MAITVTGLNNVMDDSAGTTVTSGSVTLNTGDMAIAMDGGGGMFTSPGSFSGVSINSNAMTKRAESPLADSSNTFASASIWSYPVASGFTGTCVGTVGASTEDLFQSILQITGHDTGTPFGDSDHVGHENYDGVEPSLTLDTAAGDVVIDYLIVNGVYGNTPTPDAGQTSVYATSANISSTGLRAGVSYKVATGSSTTVSWTRPNDYFYRYAAVVIKQASGGGSLKGPLTRGGPLIHGTLIRGGRLAA